MANTNHRSASVQGVQMSKNFYSGVGSGSGFNGHVDRKANLGSNLKIRPNNQSGLSFYEEKVEGRSEGQRFQESGDFMGDGD